MWQRTTIWREGRTGKSGAGSRRGDGVAARVEFLEGDAEAFGLLYDHYVSLVYRYVYNRVGDRATAEDVTSETFVRALRRIDSLSFQGRDVGGRDLMEVAEGLAALAR